MTGMQKDPLMTNKPMLRALPAHDEEAEQARLGSGFGPAPAVEPPSAGGEVVDRSIGDFLREARGLTAAQIEQILAYQKQHRVAFGEAAVALKLVSRDDVLWALSQQFHYPYAPASAASDLNPELVTALDPFDEASEMFRDIRAQLLMGVLAPDLPRRALAVLSPNIGDGKTFFAANLAVAFSQLGGRTLLIDGDMRTPRQHTLFGVQARAGLSGILAGRTDDDVIHELSNLPGLYLLPAGTVPPNPLELVQRASFALLVKEVCSKFDHVVIDSPAASHGADARVLAATSGAALLIGRRDRSRMASVGTLVQQLTKAHVRFAGVVVNEH